MFTSRQRRYLFVVILSLLSVSKGYASHFGAADIWATYIGDTAHPLRYVIHLNVYRACESGQSLLSGVEFVTASEKGGCSAVGADTSFSIQMDTIPGHGTDTLDQLCSGYKSLNSCRQPTSIYPGFNRFNYTDTIDLPFRCSSWVFTWNNCCRNGAINNLCTPSGQSIIVSCSFNDVYSNQSSPQFIVDPIPYLCLNQPAQFFNGPFDPNGDSLVVTNVQPLGAAGIGPCVPGNGPNGEIAYNNNPLTPPTPPLVVYSLANPIESIVAPYIVNAVTGIASFTPAQPGKFVLAFECDKYDPVTKALMGTTRRDVQVSVLTCAAPPPDIDSIPKTITGGVLDTSGGSNVVYVCPGATVSFSMTAKASNGGTAVFLGIDTSGSKTYGNTFTVPVNGAAVVNGTYTWTPGDTSIGVHTVTFSSVDSSCTIQQPVVQRNYLVVTIKVINGIEAIPKLYRSCPLSSTPVTLNVIGLPKGFQYSWTDTFNSTNGITNPTSANPMVLPPDTTWYIVTAPGLPGNCKTRDTVVVNVDTSNHIKITPSTPVILCKEGTVVLLATANGTEPSTDLSCGVPITPPNTNSPDSTVVVPAFGSYAGTVNSGNSCSPFASNASSHHQYLLRASDMLNSGMISGAMNSLSISVNKVVNTTLYNNVTISLMCTTLDTLPSNGALVAGVTPVYTSAGAVAISFPGFLRFPFNTIYNWDTTQNLIVDICYANATTTAIPAEFDYYYSGYPSSLYVWSDLNGVCNGGTSQSGGFPQYQLPIFRFGYFDAPTVPFAYEWKRVYGSNFVSDTTAQSPKIYIDQSSRYYVISRGKSGCAFRDSVDIYLDPPRHPYVLPADTTVCADIAVNLNASYTYTSYQWYQNGLNPAVSLSCATCQVVSAKLDTTTNYTAVFLDSVKCADTATATINIIPYPKFKLQTVDTTIKYGKSVQLIAISLDSSGDSHYKYVWSPSFTLDDPYIYNPTATPLVPTVYSVIAYNQFCTAYDSVRVNIDYRSNIMVPSAFTPNNDGKNDVFRVANLTFERVIEFRVFNRWGQQVFTALDNKGWDGTWNGTSLDMGVYNYIIRVVYPDGVEDTFNGNVTLIR